MGVSSSNAISINLERNNSIYFTGETVSGRVDLNMINNKLEANEIYITLTGEIGFFDGKVRLQGSFCYVPQESCK